MSDRRGKRSVNWRSILAAAALAAFAIPAAAGGTAHAQVVHAPASLVQQANSAPNRMVNVIVAKRGATTAPEAMIRRAGGKVTRDLSIIDGVAATVPGRAIRQLATSQSVNWVSPDAVVRHEGGPDGTVNTTNLVNTFDTTMSADTMWTQGYQGGGVNVAVVDSGVTPTSDLGGARIVASVSVNPNDATVTDGFGHGTHVAGIIAGNGQMGGGQYIGVAPKAGIVNVKVFDSTGAATVSEVISGLQWIYDNAATYNIKVVNLSLDTTLAESYNVDPLDAACEMLWFNKIVVVVAAGNSQLTTHGVIDSPANDPFVITVGAVDDQMTTSTGDDSVAPFSTFGTTVDGYAKPDLAASGVDVVSILASSTDTLAVQHPTHIVNTNYFDMSGTSMAAPMVSGAAALLLEASPTLTPDQVKYRFEATATKVSSPGTGSGEVNIYNANRGLSKSSANTGIPVSQGLQAVAGNGITAWDSASWGSTYWGASWSSASWGSASWGSASWGSASWGSASWGSDYWGKTHHHPKSDAGSAVPFGKKTGQMRGG